ncbi:MAG: DUF374 domain-containing protein [Hyphomicrobiaceae bacterium]|nr:DUF374 domain-containing protein [Hyphomicrobiaceae bacterium]
MARLPIDKRTLNGFAGKLGAKFIKLVHRTSSVAQQQELPADKIKSFHPCIIAFWHGQFMLIPGFCPKDMPVANMVARHGDGELIGAALKEFGMDVIRGSGAAGRKKDRGGVKALREAVRALESGLSVPMTADVPPGPARKAGLGIVKIAQLSGRPIVPVAAASSRYRALDTWSRMTINLPYSRIGIIVGDPITVAADAGEADLEAARQAVERELNAITARVYEMVGADPTRATPHTALSPEAAPAKAGLGLSAYQLVTRAGTPLAGAVLRYRQRQHKEDPARMYERFGQTETPRPQGTFVWLHAASVGETNAILPVMTALRGERPDLKFLLTTGTVTSAAMAAQRLAPGDIHQYAPWDTTPFVRRFLDHWQPAAVILTESEIWPNTIIECHARGIPIALINGRMSDRSFARWRKNPGFSRPLFSRLRTVLAQNEKLARRFRELGARDTHQAGNLKIDAPPLPVNGNQLEAFRATVAGRPIWVAASTHPGEDEVVISAHRRIAAARPDVLTIIAPRHPERGDDIVRLAQAAGFTTARRSLGESPDASTGIYIADTIGELGLFYSASTVAFVGGSLVARGGQNPIEAIRFDTVVLTGPDTSNFTDAYAALLRRGGALQVTNAAGIADAVTRLLSDEIELARMRQGATAALDSLSGALDKTVTALLALLPKPDGKLQRAS